jgi:hypothetical protein
MGKIISAIIGGLLKSLWATLFPPKTAADQRADDLAATVKDANNAIETSQKVDRENLASVESDLDKRVRDTNS